MSIVSDVTVTQFELVHLSFYYSEPGVLSCIAKLKLLNADNGFVAWDEQPVSWTPQEWAVINAKIAAKKAEYAAATGWMEYVRQQPT